MARQSAAVPDVHAPPSQRSFARVASGAIRARALYTTRLLLRDISSGIAIAALLTAFASASRDRRGPARNADRDVQSAAVDRALAARADLVRPGRRQRDLRAVHAVLWAVALNTFAGFRAVSPTLRMVGQNYGLSRGLRRANPDSRRVPEHPHGAQGRLGVRVAHSDRGRARIRRQLGLGRARLVYLRAQESAA